LVPQGRKEILVPKEFQALKDHKDRADFKEILAIPGLRVILATQDLRVILDPKAILVTQDPRVILVPKDLLATLVR